MKTIKSYKWNKLNVHIWQKLLIVCTLCDDHNKDNRYIFSDKNEEQIKNHLCTFYIFVYQDTGNKEQHISASESPTKENPEVII